MQGEAFYAGYNYVNSACCLNFVKKVNSTIYTLEHAGQKGRLRYSSWFLHGSYLPLPNLPEKRGRELSWRMTTCAILTV